jgi:D-alanyl-D-alanine carboxypeptidase
MKSFQGKFQKLVLGIILILLPFSSGCLLLQPLSDNIQDELYKAVDRGLDGIIVHVNQGGKTASFSAGLKERTTGTLADPDSLFKIASISKLYVAAATTMLIADDTLDQNGTVADYLPSVAGRIANSQDITLRMLVQHRSGIPDFIYHPNIPFDPLENNSDTYDYFLDSPADFAPDEHYAYSNTNYFLIGEILDDVLGYSHHTYVRNEILTPLGLNDTYSLLSEVSLAEVASGYLVGWDQDLKYQEHIQPSGSMVATAADVAVFIRALIDGTLFTSEEQNLYTSLYPYEHTGWVHGYTSIARYHPDLDAVVVQMVNTSSDELFWIELEKTYMRIIEVLERNPL